MNLRGFCCLLCALLALPASLNASEDHPFKKVSAGDFFEYSIDIAYDGKQTKGTTTWAVAEKSEKQVVLRVATVIDGVEHSSQEWKIDLGKSFNPNDLGGIGGGIGGNPAKTSETTEKIKLLGCRLEFRRTMFEVNAENSIETTLTYWFNQNAPWGIAKIEMHSVFATGAIMDAEVELTEAGKKR